MTRCLFLVGIALLGMPVGAEEPKPLVTPKNVRKLVADGKHNAFTALVRWKDSYWLSFRTAKDHNSGDGDLVVLRSADGKDWTEAMRQNVLPDDRDPQFLATEKRLFLYNNAMKGTALTAYVTYTDDGKTWSKPAEALPDRFIMWKPIAHDGKFYATMHKKDEGSSGKGREVFFIASKDGLTWEKISKVRGGNWESETTIWPGPGKKMTAFLRQKYGSPPCQVLEADAPYQEWKPIPTPVTHLSGHCVHSIDGTTYLLSRTIDKSRKTGTMIYLYANGKATPYCELPSGGDCAYPEAALLGDEMLVSWYSSHEGATNIYLATVPLVKEKRSAADGRFLYVAAPGIRNLLEFGGAGVLVFDINKDHAFVKRIATPASEIDKPENIKGVCACAATKKLYFSTLTKLYCVDLVTEKTLWEKALPGGCDRMSITPDGKTLYVPTLEKDHWNVVEGETGELLSRIETKSGAHNTVVSRDGKRMYLAGLRSPLLGVADTTTHKLVGEVGPFSAPIRPFTTDAAGKRCYVTVNKLLGFEVGDLDSGKKLHRVEVKGFEQGMVKRHGCPSHGVGLTPDEKELWLCDAANQHLHVFDLTQDPPKQIAGVKLRDQPGWVTFSLDGKYAYPSTGEIIDVKSRKIIAALKDEKGREVHSEKMVEIHFREGMPVRNGDQFGVGRKQER